MTNVLSSMSSMGDQSSRLLERIRQGDSAALDEFLAHSRQLLRRMVELRLDMRLRSRVDASDILQEAQIEIANRLNEYLSRPNPIPIDLWLRRTALENLYRQYRRHVDAECRSVAREVRLPDASSRLLLRELVNQSAPSGRIREEEMLQRLQSAIGDLADDDREIVLMRVYEGLDNESIGQVVSLSPAMVSRRFGRALLKLRARLADLSQAGSDA